MGRACTTDCTASAVNVPRLAQRIAATVFVGVALVFFGIAIVSAWHDTHGRLPSFARLGGAALLVAIGLAAAAIAWVTLLGAKHRLDTAAALLLSQLARYVPGAIWQAAGLVSLARSAGVRVGRSVTAFTVMALTQAVAGCTFAIVLGLTWTSISTVSRVLLCVGGIATLALLDRRWMVALLHAIPRTRNASLDVVPAQGAVVRSCLASIATLAATSAAYLVLLGSFGPVHKPLFVIAAYAVAWTIGFVAIPIPSGLGLREAVLAAILHGIFPPAVIVAASVYQRLVSIATEGLFAAIASQRLRPARLAALRAEAEANMGEGPVSDEPTPPSP